MVQADVETLDAEDEKLIARAILVLKKRPNAKTVVEKLVIEKRLVLLGDEIVALAEARMRGEKPPSRRPPTEPKASEPKASKPKASKPKASEPEPSSVRPKTKVVTKSDKGEKPDGDAGDAKKPDLDANFVKRAIEDFELSMVGYAKRSKDDPEGALQAVATKAEGVTIPAHVKPATQKAVQALLDSIVATVSRVFDEGGDSLVIPKSAEQIAAEQHYEEISSKHDEYEAKMLSHLQESKVAKTAAGREYERSRAKHYKDKKAALPPRGAELITKTEAPGAERKKRIADAAWDFVGDMKKKAKSVFAAVGGLEGLNLPEGTDGGVESMHLIIQDYATKLNRDADS